MTPIKLSSKDYYKVKDSLRILLRGCSMGLIEAITKLIQGFEWQAQYIKRVDQENSQLRQTNMSFTAQPIPFTPQQKPEPMPVSSLKDRLKLMDQQSDVWRSCLKHNKLTHEQALAIIYAHE